MYDARLDPVSLIGQQRNCEGAVAYDFVARAILAVDDSVFRLAACGSQIKKKKLVKRLPDFREVPPSRSKSLLSCICA